jgi:hypothetical protein
MRECLLEAERTCMLQVKKSRSGVDGGYSLQHRCQLSGDRGPRHAANLNAIYLKF